MSDTLHLNATLGELVKTLQQQTTIYNGAFYAIVERLSHISKTLDKILELAKSGYLQVAINE